MGAIIEMKVNPPANSIRSAEQFVAAFFRTTHRLQDFLW